MAACMLVATACGSEGESGMPAEVAVVEPSVASPEPDTTAPAAPEPPTVEEPVPDPEIEVSREIEVATYPMAHRRRIAGMAGFWWGPSAFAEVAQSMLVPEAFELEEIRFGVMRTSVVRGWQTRSMEDEELQWGHDVFYGGTIPDAVIRVTIWPLSGPGEEELDMAGVSPISQQTVASDLPISGFDVGQAARVATLKLDQAVALEPGHYLVSLGVESFGDPHVFNTYLWGRNYGWTDQIGFNRDGGTLTCEYPSISSENNYRQGRAYYRVIGTHSHPMRLENLTTIFREHRAKVIDERLNDCKFDPMLPGDLEIALLGRT